MMQKNESLLTRILAISIGLSMAVLCLLCLLIILAALRYPDPDAVTQIATFSTYLLVICCIVPCTIHLVLWGNLFIKRKAKKALIELTSLKKMYLTQAIACILLVPSFAQNTHMPYYIFPLYILTGCMNALSALVCWIIHKKLTKNATAQKNKI